MRASLFLFFLCSSILFVQPSYAQKKTPREVSGENLRKVLFDLYKYKNIEKDKKKQDCDIDKILKVLSPRALAPTNKEATDIINRLMDSLRVEPKDRYAFVHSTLSAINSSKMVDFVFSVTRKDYGDLKEARRDSLKAKYYRIKNLKTKGYEMLSKQVTIGVCKGKVTLNVKLVSGKLGYKKNLSRAATIEWKFFSKLTIDCPCNKQNRHKVKNTVYEFEATTQGPMVFERSGVNPTTGKRVSSGLYGLRFDKLKNPKGKRTQLICCTKEDEKSEDGSYTDPNEPIRYDSPFINTGLGIGFVQDGDTQIVGNAGVLFPVASMGDNPIFVGGQIGIQSSSVSSDFPVNEYRIGPIVEYDHNLNDSGLEWVSGIHTGYLFGNADLGIADQDFNGFFANLYTGLDIPLGDNISLAVLTSFLEFQSLAFDFGDESVSESSGPNFDRINVTAGVRFNFGN